MATVIILPKQGQSVESCIITELKKKKGDVVKKGDVLFAYETDKASFEEESPVDGVVLESYYNEGDEVEVLLNMMVIGEPGEDISGVGGGAAATSGTVGDASATSASVSAAQDSNAQQAGTSTAGSATTAEATVAATNAASTASASIASQSAANAQASIAPQETNAQASFVSPRAKMVAAKEALNAEQLAGSGPGGRVIERDVKAALENRPKLSGVAKKMVAEEGLAVQGAGSGLAGTVTSADFTTPVNALYGVDYEDKKLSNMRKIIAKSMHASLQNSAQLTHHLGADARRMLELRKKAKAALEAGKLSVNITLNDMVCFAVIKALKKFPNVNSHFMGDAMRLFNKVHLGLAVDTERGLMVPAVRNADDLSITGLANQLKEVANSCKKGAISPELLAAEAATFTVSNLGNYGVEMFTPVINLPQSAILGVNTIVPRPKDLGEGVYAFVPYIGLSLTYDHRSLDGGEATRFLKQIAIEIENLDIEVV